MASWKCSSVFSMIQRCISLALTLLSLLKSTLSGENLKTKLAADLAWVTEHEHCHCYIKLLIYCILSAVTTLMIYDLSGRCPVRCVCLILPRTNSFYIEQSFPFKVKYGKNSEDIYQVREEDTFNNTQRPFLLLLLSALTMARVCYAHWWNVSNYIFKYCT